MLILTRKKNESIVINKEIEITVVEIAPGQVRIGIKAPRQMEILRKEILEATVEESKKAAESSREMVKRKEELKGLFGDGENSVKKD